MQTWIIEPRDPLLVGDGRPFGTTPGDRAVSLPFPFPSTTAGGVRTRDGLDADGRFQAAEVERVRGVMVRGPLLAELQPDAGEVHQWFAPAPADALVLDLDPCDESRVSLRWLAPIAPPTGALTNLPQGLAPVGTVRRAAGKPAKQAPRYWRWTAFENWLRGPDDEDSVSVGSLGHGGPVAETRMHVSIDRTSKTAAEGLLFQTRGLEFAHRPRSSEAESDRPRAVSATRLGIGVETDAANLSAGLAPLGGERRLVEWRGSSKPFPACPDDVRARVLSDQACRVVLLTPGCFRLGWRPEWLLSDRNGVTPELAAAAVGRPQVVSGWDFAFEKDGHRGRPKPTRRLAPAGTVLFLRLRGSPDDLATWMEQTWMHCVSDDEQDRLDGFGLAAVGTWDGKLRERKVW